VRLSTHPARAAQRPLVGPAAAFILPQLHDTPLEPLCAVCAGERTSQAEASRHLHSLLQGFAKLSREERPGWEVSPLAHGVIWLLVRVHGHFQVPQPLSSRLQAGLCFFHPSLTHRPVGVPCGSLSLVQTTRGRPMGLPRCMQVPSRVG
jgi:hypothetical protein